jgi:hypothetical protein
MKGNMLIIWNGGGGDLYSKVVDEVAANYITSLPGMKGYDFFLKVNDYLCEGDDYLPRGKGADHIILAFNLQSPVVEQLSAQMDVSAVLYLDYV